MAHGNIYYNQVRSSVRQGTGALFQMATGTFTNSHVLIYDANGNAIDGGGKPFIDPTTTKGDILVNNGTSLVRLGVGTNGQVLTANNVATDGIDWETPGSAAGMVQIGQVTVSTATATITFAAISASYTNLKMTIMGRESAAIDQGDIYMQFNGDTAANYFREFVGANNTNASNGDQSGVAKAVIATLPGANAPTSAAGAADVMIYSYTGTTFHKNATSAGGWHNSVGIGGTQWCINVWWLWASTSAVTSILLGLVDAGNNFNVGTQVTLYGLT